MAIHSENTVLEKMPWIDSASRVGWFMLLLACGLAVFVFGSNYYTIFPTNKSLVYEASLAGVFLIASIWLNRQDRYKQHSQVAYAFFVASFVWVITTASAGVRERVLVSLQLSTLTPPGMAAAKIMEALLTIFTILVLTRASGASLGSIFVRRGNLKWGLILGMGLLVNFLSSALMFFSSRYSKPDLLASALIWGLVFSLANGFMEELWFRALFLRKLDPLLGVGGGIILTATWWSLMHAGAYYFSPIAILFFLANLFTFGLAFGFVMRKTDSVIGPGLMHAASDLFLFLATLV